LPPPPPPLSRLSLNSTTSFILALPTGKIKKFLHPHVGLYLQIEKPRCMLYLQLVVAAAETGYPFYIDYIVNKEATFMMQTQTIIIALIAIFIVYRIYLRVRRSIGWQQLNAAKLQISSIILTLLGIILVIFGASHPVSLLSDAAGIVIGGILAYYGAAMTRFEQREGRWHYRPSTWIGGIVTALFFVRILYRIYDMFVMTSSGSGISATDRLQSIAGGWSAGLMLILFSYYVAYNVIIMRKQKHHLSSRVG